jgi:hypothetical protein
MHIYDRKVQQQIMHIYDGNIQQQIMDIQDGNIQQHIVYILDGNVQEQIIINNTKNCFGVLNVCTLFPLLHIVDIENPVT